MFEIDKAAFGAFLAEQRKAKGYTQKELAEKLLISDKAVSKWERGLSMPDISLLVPLAEILDVSVTELLEGKKLDRASEMKPEQVDNIVKKALALSEDTPEKTGVRKKRNALILGACALAAAAELTVGMCGAAANGAENVFSEFRELLIMEAALFMFGIYFWIFIKERLPSYYDENRINAYSDGVFRMHIPGVRLHNGNWHSIIKCMRIWLAAAMVAVPLTVFAGLVLPVGTEVKAVLEKAVLILYLAALFIPLYITAKKND